MQRHAPSFLAISMMLSCTSTPRISTRLVPAPEAIPVVLPHISIHGMLAVEPPPEPFLVTKTCDISEKIGALSGKIQSLPVAIGKKEYPFQGAGGKWSKDVERNLVLGLIHPETCEERIVPVTHRSELTVPQGYEIQIHTRPTGMRWNYSGTEYDVLNPSGFEVVAVWYPHKANPPVLYIPFSPALRTGQFLNRGEAYPIDLAERAWEQLRERQVLSHAVLGVLVVDTNIFAPAFAARLLVIEHMDYDEFRVAPEETRERLFTRIGANLDAFARSVCSQKAACGPMQFIPPTYISMRQKFSTAGLISSVMDGRRDPLNAMMAAVLLNDSDLAGLRDALKPMLYGQLVQNQQLTQEAVAAMYNAGPRRVVPVLISYLSGGSHGDWITHRTLKGLALYPETRGYIEKLRYFAHQWPDTEK